MPIDFACPSCQRMLRVPDTAVGSKAKCPQCQGLATVPAQSVNTSENAAGQPAAMPPQFPGSGFPGVNVPGGPEPAKPNTNPYAAPQVSAQPHYSPPIGAGRLQYTGGPVRNQVTDIGTVFDYALEIWKANLGLLVGVTVTVMAVNYAMTFVLEIGQAVLENNQNGDFAIPLIIAIVGGNILSMAIQFYLGVGQAIIGLKLAKRQPAAFGDLLSAGTLFWPVLGASILFGIAVMAGFILLIAPGVMLLLFFWPYYYLLVDRKAGFIESFDLAKEVTRNNKGTAFLIWLTSIGLSLLGVLACCVGILFAAPLVSMLWVVAYLMMSGQLSAHQDPGKQPMVPPATNYQ